MKYRYFRSVQEWVDYERYKSKLASSIKKYKNNPAKFCEEMFGIKLFPYQKRYVESL